MFFVFQDSYDTEKDKDRVIEDYDDVRDEAKHSMFNKGQSKRIWNELFKVSMKVYGLKSFISSRLLYRLSLFLGRFA